MNKLFYNCEDKMNQITFSIIYNASFTLFCCCLNDYECS